MLYHFNIWQIGNVDGHYAKVGIGLKYAVFDSHIVVVGNVDKTKWDR